MNIEYHKWWSESLHQDMELKVYGHAGKPLLVFPAQSGRFFEFEDFGMVNAISWFLEEGLYQVFTVDSVDSQSWANWSASAEAKALRHEDYDRYITSEIVPFVKNRLGIDEKLITTGVSMGAYHAANFFFRHPNLFDGMISLSGLFNLRMFVGDFINDDIYFNSPLLYLPNLNDPWYLDKYRQSHIIACAGQGTWEEAMVEDLRSLQSILQEKRVPAWIDLWGYDVNHDWPWWRQQLPYFLGALLEND